MQKISRPGFLAEGFRFPVAKLDNPVTSKYEFEVFSLLDHEDSLRKHDKATNTNIPMVANRIIFVFISSTASYVNFIFESACVAILRT